MMTLGENLVCRDAVQRAIAFLEGFEDDEGQIGVVDDLARLRQALAILAREAGG